MQNAELKVELKKELQGRIGEGRAITAKRLCRRFGLKDDRLLRLAIRELRREIPVLSSGKGYFIPTGWKELHHWGDAMTDRLKEDALTRRDTLQSARRYLPPEQLEMKV
jgi:hypothetical protein